MEDLTKISESIQAIGETVSRIDERVSTIRENQVHMHDRVTTLENTYSEILSKIAVLVAANGPSSADITGLHRDISNLDKRVDKLELSSLGGKEKWKQVVSFGAQLLWIVLAAWILIQLNLTGGSPLP